MEEKKSDGDVFNVDQLERKPPATSKKGKFFKKLIIPIILLLVLFAAFFGGFALGRVSLLANINRFNQLSNPNNPMFANLTGVIQGKVVQIAGSKAYVESSKGGRGIFNIADSVTVDEISGGKVNNLGNSKDKIRLNEPASIKIAALNGAYAIISVTYIKDMLELNITEATKSASPSAKASQKSK